MNFTAPETISDATEPLTPVEAAESAEPLNLPPGGLLDLDDALAEALAAVEAVEAEQISARNQALTAEPPAPETLPQGDLPARPEIRGMPVSGGDEQIRDLKLKLMDARHRQERDQKELDQLMADLSVTRKRYHKLGAEHDELRKRLQRAELDLPDQGARNVLNALLGPLDHLMEVFDHLAARETLSTQGREALTMLQGQWQRAFGVLQVTPFDALGQPYDAHLHEYIAQAPSDAPPGQVIRQVGRGYLLAGRLLRSARVVVSGGLPGTQPVPTIDLEPAPEADADPFADL